MTDLADELTRFEQEFTRFGPKLYAEEDRLKKELHRVQALIARAKRFGYRADVPTEDGH